MTTNVTKLAGCTASLLAFAAIAQADVKLNDNFSVSGYVTGTASYNKYDVTGVGSDDDALMEVDSIKLSSIATFEKVTGVVSLHSFANSDPVFLDAYATYDTGAGATVTFGKFLSYLGFEAFDYPNMLQISYANALSAFIPAYHSGVKVDFNATESVSVGLALLDSVYGPNYYQGDGDLNNGFGFEGYLKHSAGALTTFLGFGYDTNSATDVDQLTGDLWLQYDLGSTTLAAEFCYSKIDTPTGKLDGHFWLLLAMQSFDKWSVTGRLSGGEDETVALGAKFMRYTVSPAVTLTDNLGFLFEYSYTDYKNAGIDKDHYLAAQFVFKF